MAWPDLPSANPTRKKPENINARSRKSFEDIGWIVETTQTFNPHSGHNHDLLGFADLLMYVPGHPATVLVQACMMGDRNKRRDKILASPLAYNWLTGKPHHHVWIDAWKRKKGGGWENEITIIVEEDFDLCLIESNQIAPLEHAKKGQLIDLVTAKNTRGK